MATPLILDLYVNNQFKTVTVADDTEPLLYVLRNQVGTKSVKFGCGVAQCGACTVIIDGVTKRSCVTPLNTVADGAQVTTLEGLGQPNNPNGPTPFARDGVPRAHRSAEKGSGAKRVLHGIQKAFADNQAGQCAYCAAGIIMGSYNWLLGRRSAGNAAVPTDDEVKDFLSGIGQTPPFVYLCRCGTHMRIIQAIQQASQEM
jgi:aerobic-type carbon monoxide dehydrogenase small subunit (CoxS/CutS family)